MIDSIANFRDIGGIKTKEGNTIKKKRLLRSGELYDTSENDKHILASEYQLRLIVDLRSKEEVINSPDTRIKDSRYLHIDVMKELGENNAGRKSLMGSLNMKLVDEKMKEVYRNLILDKTACIEYGRFLNEVAALESGSCLFHCFAGKDRTGIAAMLILEILGTDRADIFNDYLETNHLRAVANQRICDEAKAKGLSGEQVEALGQLLAVKEEYLQYVYEVIEEFYGDFSRYLKNGLGISRSTVEQLRSNYII